MELKPVMYQMGKMWDQTDANENFYVRYNTDVNGGAHWHDCFEIELVVGGSCCEVLNGVSIPVKKGDVTLITPADLHEVHNIEALEIYNLMFTDAVIDEKILNAILLNENSIISCHLDDEDFEYVLNILRRADKEYHTKEHDYERFVIDSINQLLSIMLRHSETSTSNRKELSIRTAAFYMKMSFKDNPSLEKVAKVINFEPAYFSIKFHEVMGMTFKRYLNEIKLNYAAKVLKTDLDKSVSDICYESGFESLSHFHREFKKKYGSSPLKYRNG